MLTITLNRPDVLNALNREVHADLRDALELAKEPDSAQSSSPAPGAGFCVGQGPAGVPAAWRRRGEPA